MEKMQQHDLHSGRTVIIPEGSNPTQTTKLKEQFATESRSRTASFLTAEFPTRGAIPLNSRCVETPISECRAPTEQEKAEFLRITRDLILSTEANEELCTKVAQLLATANPNDEIQQTIEAYSKALTENDYNEPLTIMQFGLQPNFRKLLNALEAEYGIKDLDITDLSKLFRFRALENRFKIPSDLTFGHGDDPELMRGKTAAFLRKAAEFFYLVSTDKSEKAQEYEKFVIARTAAFFRCNLPESCIKAIMDTEGLQHVIGRRRGVKESEVDTVIAQINKVVSDQIAKHVSEITTLLDKAATCEKTPDTIAKTPTAVTSLTNYKKLTTEDEKLKFVTDNINFRQFSLLVTLLKDWNAQELIKKLQPGLSSKIKPDTITTDKETAQMLEEYRRCENTVAQKAFIRENQNKTAFDSLLTAVAKLAEQVAPAAGAASADTKTSTTETDETSAPESTSEKVEVTSSSKPQPTQKKAGQRQKARK